MDSNVFSMFIPTWGRFPFRLNKNWSHNLEKAVLFVFLCGPQQHSVLFCFWTMSCPQWEVRTTPSMFLEVFDPTSEWRNITCRPVTYIDYWRQVLDCWGFGQNERWEFTHCIGFRYYIGEYLQSWYKYLKLLVIQSKVILKQNWKNKFLDKSWFIYVYI